MSATQSALQSMVDAMGDAASSERAKYHLTLGEAVEFLADVDVSKPVIFDDGQSFERPHSYRGYYQDLALQPCEEEIDAMEAYTKLNDVLDSELTGYKGGQFLMDANTPLWQAEWGDAGESRPIMGIEETEDAVVFTLGEPTF